MRARKVDTTQDEIVNALERCGCKVLRINGVFDLLVRRGDRLYMLECKGARKTLTKAQEKLLADGWPLKIAFGPDHALDKVEVPLRARF